MATAPEDLILPFSITAPILLFIYVILGAPLFGYFLFAVFVLFFLYNYVSFQSLERDFNWIRREYRLLRALSYDKVRLSNSEAEIDMRARDLWKLEDNPKMTVLLDPAEVDWLDIAECVVSRATVFIDRFEEYKERRQKPAVAAVRYIWTLNNYFIKDALSFEMKQIKEEINAHLKKNVDICGILERSRTQIRSLQDRPIEHESIIHKENVCSAADLVSSTVHKINCQITDSVYGLTEKIELIKLQLLLLGAFMKDLEGIEFLSETEKFWVEEHKEIIDEAQRAIESFIQRTGGWFSPFSNLMARRKLKGDMKIIDAAFSDLYRRKERYGFKFIRRDQISKFDTRSPNEEEIQIKNAVKGMKDKKDYWLKQLQVSRTGEGDLVKFRSMCETWENMHRLAEEVIAIEGVDNFRGTWLRQMKCSVDVVEEVIEAYIKDEAARNTDYTSFGDSFFAYDPHSNVNSFFTGLPDYFLLYRSTYDRRHEVKPSVEIERMWQVINCFERTIKAYQIEIREESTSVVGLKEDIGVLISRLTNREPVVSIVGMRGIGKTTLAKKVFNHEVILKQFHNNRYWVCIGQKSLLNKIEMLVLGVLESQAEQRRREYWIKELRHFLGEERYLLVLEDINAKETWDTLKAAFPATNGSTIMLTTRHKSVASHADQSSTQHILRLRTKEESWKLFTQMVHLPPEIPPESVKIIKAKVVGRCGGLPLAIFHSGYRLIGEHVTQENSSTVLESIDCYQKSWTEAAGIEEFPVQLSKCLSYIRLFPKDYEIPARRVAASWVAEELLEQRAEDSPECVAEKCLADLKNRYIIQVLETKPDGKIKTFCLHYALSEGLPNDSSVKRLADYGKDEISELDLRDYRNLVTFLSFDVQEGNKPGENIGNFLHRGIATVYFDLLKVLDLERVFRPILPKKIGNLINLRYLGLRWTYLEAIPSSIGNLTNLQILDVKHTYIRKLPGSIWKLQKLRHLYLNQSYRSKFVQPRGAALKNLQTLWGVFVDEDSPLNNGLNRLMDLRKLKLAFQLELPRQKVLAGWISQLSHLQSLRLKSIGEMGEPLDLYLEPLSHLSNLSSLYLFGRLENPQSPTLENPSIMEQLPQSLTEVTLSASQLSNIDPIPKLGKLPKLRSLCLYSGSYKRTTMVCSIDDFPQLLVLKLWMLDTLQSWDVQEGAMRNLRELEIRSCNKLEIPIGLTRLETLQELKLTNMPEDFNIKIQNNFAEAEEKYPDKLFTPSIMIKY